VAYDAGFISGNVMPETEITVAGPLPILTGFPISLEQAPGKLNNLPKRRIAVKQVSCLVAVTDEFFHPFCF
jgi:hypothetical protein